MIDEKTNDQDQPATRRPVSPRRLIRPIRLGFYLVIVVIIVWGFSDYTVTSLPDGPSPFLSLGDGQRVLVETAASGRPLQSGDLLLFRTEDGRLRSGVLVARAGEELDLDLAGGRIRRASGTGYYPAPRNLFDRLPLRPGELLILAEDPLLREAGGIVPESRVVARIIATLPF